ncbi:YraN family protein [Patescibacteria group bacterium]|nr:YraN family protein [Patescibacteria group bacterium]
MNSKQLGNLGENIAEKYLRKKRYKILAKNFKTKWGEIDLVGRKKKIITFFEVKTIKSRDGFSPEDQIGRKKKRQLLKMAQIYFSTNKIPPETPHQINILAIEITPDFKKAKVRHFKNTIEDSY